VLGVVAPIGVIEADKPGRSRLHPPTAEGRSLVELAESASGGESSRWPSVAACPITEARVKKDEPTPPFGRPPPALKNLLNPRA